ncbi:hypothetical protein [Paenimyroides viscosum]|uniref:hypothetical protein n=1 Tax=Paenimyroides viscosum TaxID=2488729 RepID=UPI00193A798C|nr:hypothetical protein [Paenimyroides viscosum]
MEERKFNPEEFLRAKVVSPLEQEKLVGGIAAAEDPVIVVSTIVTIVVRTVTP